MPLICTKNLRPRVQRHGIWDLLRYIRNLKPNFSKKCGNAKDGGDDNILNHERGRFQNTQI